MLVEDEEDIATLVRTYLEKDGFRVIWAARGVDGLLALEQNEIRLAILDLQLPLFVIGCIAARLLFLNTSVGVICPLMETLP